MTSWKPTIPWNGTPVYLQIAEAIERASASGELAPGTRLPTHRELASTLRVAVTTVTRAYQEAERRGVLAGHVGRGTFVSGTARTPVSPGAIDLSVNSIPPLAHFREVLARMRQILTEMPPGWMLDYQPSVGIDVHREAAAGWLASRGLAADADGVAITSGGQHALMCLMMALCRPGDSVIVERVTFAGIRGVLRELHLRPVPIAMDREGILPDALAESAARHGARVLYCMSTAQNPTGATMSPARRELVAAVAAEHGIEIVEDDTFGFLDPAARPIAATRPDGTCYVTSLSKVVAPGFRLGFVSVPRRYRSAVERAMRATAWMASAPMVEVLSRLIADGTVSRLAEWKVTLVARRQALARSLLPADAIESPPVAGALWLRVPEGGSALEYAAAARRAGVLVAPADDFTIEGEAPPFVRVALGPPARDELLEEALRRLDSAREGHHPGPAAP